MSETPEYLTTKIWPTDWLVSSDEQCEFLSSYFVSSSILLSNSNTQSQRSIEWLTIGVFSASVGKYKAKNQWVSRDVRVMRFILVHHMKVLHHTWENGQDRDLCCVAVKTKQNKTSVTDLRYEPLPNPAAHFWLTCQHLCVLSTHAGHCISNTWTKSWQQFQQNKNIWCVICITHPTSALVGKNNPSPPVQYLQTYLFSLRVRWFCTEWFCNPLNECSILTHRYMIKVCVKIQE